MVKPVKTSAAAAEAPASPTPQRTSSYAAKVSAIPGEFWEADYGAFKLNGTVHLLLRPDENFSIICARCCNKFEPGSFVPHMTGQRICTQKNADRSDSRHSLEDDPGYPKNETELFWKGMYEDVNRDEEMGDQQGVWIMERGDQTSYVVYPQICALKAYCVPCETSLSLNKVKVHLNKHHNNHNYGPLTRLEVTNAGKFSFVFYAFFN